MNWPSGPTYSMNFECLRISDQLHRAFAGDAWHGPPLKELLSGINAAQASSRPLPAAHSIWQLVAHIDIYVRVTLQAIDGTPLPRLYETQTDWPHITDTSESAWNATLDALFRNAGELVHAIKSLPDSKLDETAPGRDYNFYYLLHGVVQHSLYHGGQIALLKKL